MTEMNREMKRGKAYRFNTDGLALSSIEVICAPRQFLKVYILAAI